MDAEKTPKRKKEDVESEKTPKRRKEDVESKKRKSTQKEAKENVESKKRRQSDFFLSFFKPDHSQRGPKITTGGTEFSRFLPFEIKKGMKLAPTHRRPPITSVDERELFDRVINADADTNACSNYIYDLKQQRMMKMRRRCRSQPPFNEGAKLKAKLFQFHDNYRPPYYGTWRKTSTRVTGRCPLRQDTLLNYDVNSDEEWEDEPNDAEDCNSDDEDEDEPAQSDKEDDDDDDGFFVEHGYLSDDEGNDEENDDGVDAETRRARMAAKAEAWKCDMRFQKEKKSGSKLIPFVIGPCWNVTQLDKPLLDKLKSMVAVKIGATITSYNRPQPPPITVDNV